MIKIFPLKLHASVTGAIFLPRSLPTEKFHAEVKNAAAQIFGAEGAKNFAAHADELKASGAKFCDCGACKPGLEILKNKSLVLD